METQNNTTEKEFHAVEYMRQERAALTQKFLDDKQQYLEYLKNTMADFKLTQKMAIDKQHVTSN